MTDSTTEPNSAGLTTDADGKLAFPCRYPVKAMTQAEEQSVQQVLETITSIGLPVESDRVRVRPSRNGRFQSITVEVDVSSREQLEQTYAALRALDCVLMTL